jgi:hypothetical protein
MVLRGSVGSTSLANGLLRLTLNSPLSCFVSIFQSTNESELRLQGRMMWSELQRGFDGAETALENVCPLTGKPIPPQAREEQRFIPDGLEPFDT